MKHPTLRSLKANPLSREFIKKSKTEDLLRFYYLMDSRMWGTKMGPQTSVYYGTSMLQVRKELKYRGYAY